MKHFFCILISLLMILSLYGCTSGDPNSISFHYCRESDQYQYFEENSVICTESRSLTGHRDDLRYMVGLYLAGPMEEGLVTSFTKTTRLLSVEKDGDTILIELSDHTKTLTDSEFTLACACLTLTCMDFTECSEVTIVSGERSITMNADTIILSDTLPQQETTGG